MQTIDSDADCILHLTKKRVKPLPLFVSIGTIGLEVLMADLTIPAGQYCLCVLAGNGGSNGPQALEAGSVTVSLSAADYAKFYVANKGPNPSGPGQLLAWVPKVQAPAGGSYDVTVNASGNDAASGDPLSPISLDVSVTGPAPVPAAATNFMLVPGPTFAALSTAPPDPGSGTISF
jgi:hypothetical protein